MASETMDTAQGLGAQGTDIAAKARAAADTARDTVGQVADRARRKMDDMADTAAGVADQVSARANDTLAQVLRYTSEHPLQALGVVLLAGFVVGRLSRR